MNYCHGVQSEGCNVTIAKGWACNAAAQLLIEEGYNIAQVGCPYMTVLTNNELCQKIVAESQPPVSVGGAE